MKLNFLLTLALLIALPADAAKTPMPSDAPKSYETECASCHMAYPPELMGQKNWQNIMSGLGKHFGTDASLDAKTQTEIANWLMKNAATQKKYAAMAPDNRMTKSSWFIKEHDEVGAAVWKRASIKSAANCTACHKDAATGGFSESNIQVPAK
jgi:nitrate/TMAO reductase-like tetraheme cytochrome c subunit